MHCWSFGEYYEPAQWAQPGSLASSYVVTTDLVPDELWVRIAPLLPKRPARRKRHPGRLPVPDRVALAGIIYVLRKGVAWRDVSSEVVGCSGVTAWRRLRDRTQAGPPAGSPRPSNSTPTPTPAAEPSAAPSSPPCSCTAKTRARPRTSGTAPWTKSAH
ncbi:transposase [Streptomyces albidoflavus]